VRYKKEERLWSASKHRQEIDYDKRKEHRMKKRLLLTLALLGLLVIAYTPAFAQSPDDGDNEEEIIVVGDMGPGTEDFDIDEEVIFAGGMGHGMGMEMRGPGCGLMGMADDLELTKDQRKQMEDLTVNFRKEMIPLRAQMQVMKIDLQQLIRSDAKRAEIDAKIDQIGKLRTDLQKKAVGQRLAMRALLTPEQREKANDRSCMMGKGKGGQMKEMIIKRMQNRGGKGKGL
jgi:Spy/CpxP family protein refolding chaperone